MLVHVKTLPGLLTDFYAASWDSYPATKAGRWVLSSGIGQDEQYVSHPCLCSCCSSSENNLKECPSDKELELNFSDLKY